MSQEPTPPTPKPDWQLAESLYIQGFSHAEVAQQSNVTLVALRQRIARHKWADRKRQALPVARQLVISRHIPPQVPNDQSVRPVLSRKLKALADSIPDEPPVSQRQKHSHADLITKAAQAGKLLEGWQEHQNPVICLQMLREAMPTEPMTLPAMPVQEEQPVIDVTTCHTVTAEPVGPQGPTE